ncbi:MAG: response regulator, partial [Bdellovibrionales bacterium]|nr:response regulator [Bdellovibrionales bacterium]
DIILTDIQMPVMDGVEFARRAKEDLGLSVPIIAITAHAMKGDEEMFLKLGLDDYITKPINRQNLLKLLYHYLAP